MKGLYTLIVAIILGIAGFLRGMESSDSEQELEVAEMVPVDQYNSYVGIPLQDYQRRKGGLQYIIDGFNKSKQQLDLACVQTGKLFSQMEEHKNEIFNLQKKLTYLYAIITIQASIALCFIMPKTHLKKVPNWWKKFKQWRSKRNAQSLSRKPDASLPKSEKSREIIAG